VRVTPESRYAELHLESGAALTALWADGRYCLNAEAEYGIDCPEMPAAGSVRAASADGLYPSLHAAVAVELGRHLPSVFRGARLSLQVAGGTMPAVVAGVQAEPRAYAAVGFGLAVGFGAAEGE
jgi:hypothetical protein